MVRAVVLAVMGFAADLVEEVQGRDKPRIFFNAFLRDLVS